MITIPYCQTSNPCMNFRCLFCIKEFKSRAWFNKHNLENHRQKIAEYNSNL